MDQADAAAAADVLVWANLRGVDTHGVMRLPYYADLVRKGSIDPKARPQLRPLLGATFLVESARSPGAVAMKLAVERVVEIAARQGVGLGLVSDTTHTGAIGYYAGRIAARGQAAIVICAGPPFMAYHGARATSLATSPIALAVPSDGEPLLVDMATSLVSNGRLRQAAASGQPLPEGAAIDADGRPRAINISPSSLADGGFALQLRHLMQAHPLSARSLWLEFAEAAALEHFDLLQEVGRLLRPLGVRVGLEHAGQRLHRIERLYELGLDYIKLDASICAGLSNSEAAQDFVRSTVALLHALAIQVHAEGVGDAADARALWACGVDGITGPWVSLRAAAAYATEP
jgi:hypothetical protein